MSLGLARGLDFAAFCKVVKTMKLVVITGTERYEVDMPLQLYNVPMYRISVQLPEGRADGR